LGGFASFSATTRTVEGAHSRAASKLKAAGVSQAVAARILDGTASDDDLASLSRDQLEAARVARSSLRGGTAGAGLAGAMAGGVWLCFGVTAFVGGLLGWLLTMKKSVLRCSYCRAVVPTM